MLTLGVGDLDVEHLGLQQRVAQHGLAVTQSVGQPVDERRERVDREPRGREIGCRPRAVFVGWRDDAEMNVATLNAELARGLRLLLWAEHLGLMSKDDLLPAAHHLSQQPQRSSEDERAASLLQRLQEQLGNPLRGLRLMSECAQSNLRRYIAKQPLVGHLLPYLTAEEATQQGLNFREEHGWIEEP